MAHIAVHRRCIRPVRLHRDDSKAVLLDQSAADCRARAIEFRGTVAGLTEQHNPEIRKAVEQASKSGIGGIGQWLGSLCNHLRQALSARLSRNVIGSSAPPVL